MKDQVPTRIGLPPGLGSLKDGAPLEVRHMYLRIGHLQELGSDKDEVPIRIGSLQSKALTKIKLQQGVGSKRIGLLQELGSDKDHIPTRRRLKKEWAQKGLGSYKS